jgi:hypothetical protein
MPGLVVDAALAPPPQAPRTAARKPTDEATSPDTATRKLVH